MAERLGFPFKKLVCFPSLFILQNVSQILTHFEPRLSFSVERNILSTVHSTTSRSFLTYCGTFFCCWFQFLYVFNIPLLLLTRSFIQNNASFCQPTMHSQQHSLLIRFSRVFIVKILFSYNKLFSFIKLKSFIFFLFL